ncbi:MAG: amino acid adenylation domain-containing protein [Chroococcidiopsidaceae cyanobacterium CP_BM_RX_35]|nr:amino acid adenylation domain-containing protein [Chroococcidiopsidaceae cyanobacterium CP_BM_RX_35]
MTDSSLAANQKSQNGSQEVFVFPVSFAQQRLWFLEQLVPGNPFYNVPTAVLLTGSLNVAALEQTFNEIVRRHEALRTTFRIVEGEPVQVIAPSWHLPLSLVDLQELPEAEREAEVQRLLTAEFQQPFELSQGSLLRIKLLQLGEAEHVLMLTMHHIVADGWSAGVLLRELGTLYNAFSIGQPSPLVDLPIQYADFAYWQREWLQGEVLVTQMAYWQQQLDDVPLGLDLPTDRPRPVLPTFRGARQFLMLPVELSEGLSTLSAREGVTLFMTLLAAFQTLLYRYTGQEDIVVGSPIANRNRSEIEGLIGFFVNSLVLRTDLSGNPPFRELLSRVREVALGAYAHQDLPFEKLVEELQPERDLNRNPLFQVVFALQNAPVEVLELPRLTLSPLSFDPGTARFDLEFQLVECLGSLGVVVTYSTDLFDAATITRMLENFRTLLESIVGQPEQRLGNLSLLTAAERYQLLVEWNDTEADYSKSLCFHQLFVEQVEQTPEAIAVVFKDKQLTYRELNSRSNQLAHYLRQLGVGAEVLVGICVERSLEMVVGVLGILKAGGAYVPLDPTYPTERLSFMMSDAQVSILLTQQRLIERLGLRELQVVCIDRNWEISIPNGDLYKTAATDTLPTENVFDSNENCHNLAYVIYTSGSTGKPKGVLVEHQGLCNLAEAQIRFLNLQPQHRILQFASLSFDASIFEMVMALRIGATLYLAAEEELKSVPALLNFLQDNQITNVTLPPTLLSVLPAVNLPALQTVVSAGEACPADVARRWAVGRRFFNAYGLTEATIWSTIDEFDDMSDRPTVGRPIANTQIYLLDSWLQPVPIGVKGELYIGGDGLARGYLNRPELTAELFIPHPFNDKPGARLYQTGDLARYRTDGKLEFLGRKDSQVKIRGFRIELGEIEWALAQHPLVREVVVMAGESVPLVAYIVFDPHQVSLVGVQDLTPLLRCFLKEKLPEYMVPSVFVVLDVLPLTPNGKVNRHALPVPNQLSSELENSYVAPRTSMEITLARIWANLLDLKQVGIYDNFFELGGDSLLSMRLMELIYQQCGCKLPLSALFLAPTVERLASRLQSETNSLIWSPLVTIQSTGSKPPFFCVHPILGVVFPYYELARHLGSDQPFYALQPLGIDGEQLPHTRIEDMANVYIEALRLLQPQGPYFLGGWSFGGLVAFEMAQQLQRANHQVALLAMLDTPAPIASNRPSLCESCKFLFNTAARSVWPYILSYFYSGPSIRPMFRVLQASSRAALSYKPEIYSNQITLFSTSEQPMKAHQDATMGWRELTAGRNVEVHRVPGNHLTMLRPPHVQVLAQQLQVCIEKALLT